jgi:cation transport ATPase
MTCRFAQVWTPAVLVAALALAVVAGSATNEWHKWAHRALVLLVLACPCSIVIAAPIPSVCAIATAAKHGVLIKGSSVVESLGIVKKLGVDKTGTLTRGFFSVSATKNLAAVDDDDECEYDPMQFAAALESKSAHPLANAVVSAYCGCIAEFKGTLPEVNKIQVCWYFPISSSHYAPATNYYLTSQILVCFVDIYQCNCGDNVNNVCV